MAEVTFTANRHGLFLWITLGISVWVWAWEDYDWRPDFTTLVYNRERADRILNEHQWITRTMVRRSPADHRVWLR